MGTSSMVGIPTQTMIEVNNPVKFELNPFCNRYVGSHPDHV